MGIFINLSNHPSREWGENQLAAARKIGKITDIPFPPIDPQSTPEQIQKIAKSLFSFIRALGKPVVMIQGEFTFTYQMVRLLQEAGIRAVSCATRRVCEEFVNQKGETVKTSYYRFEGFRDYYL